ncbi:VWA domain-containing protein [Acidaminobacter sp. JC074]|uniref:VWA domain-containing protein n=1 Tax=Acidaminobacter sp. JC074 TaxID=2530199 RepID=UPI001F0E2F95|nr:VWA domain-containing protein [Acidaminobacter sp. JC074]MCH4886381.1 VWA domain-containing protein [Acidaminobacter sp. JC074]
MKNKLLNNQGFSLIEILIVLALTSVIIMLGFSMMIFGRSTINRSVDEYEFQHEIRSTMQQTSDVIRYATAVFTIPKSSFHKDNLDDGWHYIGVQEKEMSPGVKGSEIVKYTYEEGIGHTSTVLLDAIPNVNYKLQFNKRDEDSDSSLLEFTIKTYPMSDDDDYGLLEPIDEFITEVEALNSLQVIDLSSPPYDPSVAIAFKNTERSQNFVGHVAMVLDKSTSMTRDIYGERTNREDEKRINILKTEAKALIDAFSSEENIDISLVPFSGEANDPRAFQNVNTNSAALKSYIDAMVANGSTNTGDGLRRAYYMLDEHNDTVGYYVTPKNYVIVLVDGVTTAASVYDPDASDVDFIISDGNVAEGDLESSQVLWSQGWDLLDEGTEYVDLIGTQYLAKDDFAKVYVIGFSSKNGDLNSLRDIALACNAENRQYVAGDSDELQEVFNEIRSDIVNDLWYLKGPEL